MPDSDVTFTGNWTASYTIHHYLKGTAISVKDDETGEGKEIGSSVDAVVATGTYNGKQLSLAEGSATTFTIRSDGKNEFTVEYTIPLTITAKAQTYVYNGTFQGDGDAVYTAKEDIEKKVTVDGLLEGDSLASINVSSQGDVLGVYENAVQISSARINIGSNELTADVPGATPKIIGYYAVTYVPGDLTITGRITLIKDNSGETAPDETQFTITGLNGYSETHTYGEFTRNQFVFEGLSAGEYTVTETNAAVEEYKLEVTYSSRTITLDKDNPSIDVTITNTYTERDPDAKTYKVTYAYDGPCPDGAQAQLPAQKSYELGESVDVEAAPSIEGCAFSGWTTADVEVTEGNFTMPDRAVTFTGKWTPTYTIHHYLKGTRNATPVEVKADETGCAKVGDSGDIAYATSYKGIPLTPVSGSPKKWSVTSEGDNEFTVEYTIPLTITAKAQTYAYDGKEKGEDNKTYTDESVIKDKVEVKGLLTGDKLTSIKLTSKLIKLSTATITPSEVGISFNAVKENDAAVSNAAVRNASDTGYYAVKYVTGDLTVTGKLTLTKTTSGSTTPKGAKFKVTGPNSYSKTFKYSEFKSGKLEITGLSAGEYKVEEDKDSAKVSGYDLAIAYDKQTATIGESTPAPEIKITNTYTSNSSGSSGSSSSSTDTSSSSSTSRSYSSSGPDPDDDDGPDEPMVEIDGEKIWEDFDNAYGTRPSDVDIRLYANGELVEDADFHWVSREGNTWQFTFGEMPASIGGESVIYSVQEAPVDDYDPVYSGMMVTNRLSSKKVRGYVVISGQKSWQDDSDSQKPGYIVMRLLRNGEPIAQRTSTVANGWTYSFGEQPLDDGYGHDYTYDVREDGVHGYFAVYDGNNVTNISLLGVSNGDVGTVIPDLEDVTQEELETLVKVDDYTTPLSGDLLPTGDETPRYPFAFALAGLLALLTLAATEGKRRMN